MNRISSQVEAKIIEMWFQGYSRDEIARILVVGQGTVSAILDSLPSCLEPLRDLSRTLRKLKLLPNDALRGTELLKLLAEYGLTAEQMPIFLEAIRTESNEAGYQPEKVVEGLTRLTVLEKQSGMIYPEALKEFESLALHIEDLRKEKGQVLLEIRESKKKRKKTLNKAKATEKEISEMSKLEADLNYYEIDLFDIEQILDYLSNMGETGHDPRTFVTLTKKIGSIERYISDLDKQRQARIAAIDCADKQIESEKTEIEQLKTEHEAFMAKANWERELIRQSTATENAKLQELKAEVNAANSQLSNLKIDIQQAEHRWQEIAKETERILGTKILANQEQEAIAALEKRHRLLEEKAKLQEDKIAFATVITDYLLLQPDILFDSFRVEVQRIKEIRENPNSALKPLLPALTETTISKALQAINGNPRFPIISNLLSENQQLRAENAQLQQAKFVEQDWRNRKSFNVDKSSARKD